MSERRSITREELAAALHEVGAEFDDPFTPDHPMAMHNSQAAAIFAALPPESPDSEALRAAAQDLLDFYDGGGFRAGFPEDHFTRLRAALAALTPEAKDVVRFGVNGRGANLNNPVPSENRQSHDEGGRRFDASR
jgi:hypothetical protein